MGLKNTMGSVRSGITDAAITGPLRLPVVIRYGAALALVGVATLARFLIGPQEAGLPYVAYFPAATLAAIVGGIGPAVTATLCGALVAGYLFIPPFGMFKFDVITSASSLMFCLDELIVCSAIEWMRRYYQGFMEATAALRGAHEAECQARMVAERANDAKSSFFAAANHDLRQPVQSLLLFHACLATMLRGHPAAALLAESDAALQALRGLLDRLLTVSRLEAGIDSVKPVTFALDGVIAPLVSEYRGRAAEKALDLRWVPCGLTAVSDPLMFAAILRNLIDNAIRYTPGSGQVLIGCRRLGDSVRVEVYNSGAGIPDEKIEAVFEDFVQLDNPARNSGLGYGFGLAIVRRLCDRLDHPILVTSRAGRGTCFRVTVPRGGVVPPVTPENPAEDRRALRRLVLLVDDDVLVLRSLARSLVQAGFEAVAAPSGRAALAALGGRKPDIALLDYRLGDETGLDVLAELDAAFGRGIPVCLLSGDTGVELPDEIARRGVGVLYKPIGSRDLLSVVRAMGVAVVP